MSANCRIYLHTVSILIFWFLAPTTAHSQQYPAQSFTTSDGLAHSNVYRIFQDKKGFLWLCTDYGLSVFDGQSFRSDFNDPKDLLKNPIMSISENEQGDKLICSLRDGLLFLSKDSIWKYPLTASDRPEGLLYAVSFKGRIWAIGKGKKSVQELYVIDGTTMKALKIKNAQGKPVYFNKIIAYRNELLFTATNGIYRVTDSSLQPFLRAYVNEEVIDVSRDPQGTYWIGLKDRLAGSDGSAIQKNYMLPKGQQVNDILADSAGHVWIGLKNEGMMMVSNGKLESITDRMIFKNVFTNDVLEDFEGNIWIATYGAGLFRISSTSQINYASVNTFCRDLSPAGNRKILVGSIGKVSLWDSVKTTRIHFGLLKENQYIYFARKAGNRIYVGTSDGLLIRNEAPPFNEHLLNNDVPDGAVSFYQDHNGSILIGGYNHLFRMQGNELVRDSITFKMANTRFNTVLEDRNENIWYGTTTGLFQSHQTRIINWIKNETINDLLEDHLGNIWAATNHGLYCIRGNYCRIFKEANGLSSSKCNKLIEDRNGLLWIGTLKGLCFIDPGTFHVNEYKRGIYPDEVISLCLSNDRLFIGTINSFSSLKTGSSYTQPSPLPLYINYVKTPRRKIYVPDKLDLAFNENKLMISYQALSFQNAAVIQYRYRITDLDESWHYTGNNSIELPLLPSGNYVLELSAQINKGRWNRPIQLPVYIATPFWKTAWWNVLLALAASLLFYTILRWQVIRKEKRKRTRLSVYNKILYLKQQALSALINPHFIFNCMNSIQHYLNDHDTENATNYLADFAQLIRATMEDAQQAFIGLDKELKRIRLYLSLEQLRFGDDLRYHIDVDECLSPDEIRIPNMILQPYVENAIWHGIMPKGGHGTIRISISREQPEQLKICIADDGVGIGAANDEAPRKQWKGARPYGMQLTNERLGLLRELLKQHYDVQIGPVPDANGMISGTLVIISLPLSLPASFVDQMEEGLRSDAAQRF